MFPNVLRTNRARLFLATLVAVAALLAPAPATAWDLTIMAAGWETDALDDVGGAGVRLSWAMTESVTFDIGAYYIEELRGTIKDYGNAIVDLEGSDAFVEDGFEVIPVDIGFRLGRPGIYIGAGGSYYQIDAPTSVVVVDPVLGPVTVPIADVDDEVGYYGLIGWEFGSRKTKVFIEAMYRSVEGTVTNSDIADFEVAENRVALDLSGPQFNAGFTFSF